MKSKTRTEKVDMETITLIKLLCSDYGMRLSHYYDHSGLNAPGDGRLSYMAFLAAMAGGDVTPDQESRISRSLAQVRQSLRKVGKLPLMKELIMLMKKAAERYEDDPDTFDRGDISTLLLILRKAAK